MITRPLDLSSRLRAAPRNYDWLFGVNLGLVALAFVLFGSRFVLAPGLGVNFAVPTTSSGATDLRSTTHVLTIVNEGQIFVRDGVKTLEELPAWLAAEARTAKQPALLVRAGAAVPASLLTQVLGMAHTAGFGVTLAVEEPKRSPDGRR